MANKTNMVSKLPAIFQTVTERKFFDATFDQVFSKKNSERTSGFIGRRVAGEFDPINDFYLPEPDKDRTWYQLEPTAVSKDNSTLEKTNRYFYTDIIDRIRYYGGNIGNHDRLFNSRYYSYAPPIDVDKFVNYQNYYWVPNKLPIITLTGFTDEYIETNIIGQATYNTSQNPDAIPPDFEFSNGMRISFAGTSYDNALTIEGVGTAILLTEDLDELLSVKSYTYLPWDNSLEIDGVDLTNGPWDSLSWDAIDTSAFEPDYITMERGSVDANAWSRTNKWYHTDTISTVLNITNTSFPINTTRALRPILEFERDLELYNSGTHFVSSVEYFARESTDGECISTDAIYDDVQGQLLATVRNNIDLLSELSRGQKIVFPCDTTQVEYDGEYYPASEFVWTTYIINDDGKERVELRQDDGLASEGDTIMISGGQAPVDGGKKGMTYYFTEGNWALARNRKTSNNQPIEFALYDSEYNSLGDDVVYPGTDFNGSEIFSYKLDTDPDAYIDTVLGLPIVYRSLGQLSDIIFDNDLQSDRYNYIVSNTLTPIDGYYYFRKIDADNEYSNSWYPAEDVSKQRVLDRFTVFDTEDMEYFLSVMPYNNDIIVTIDGEETDKFEIIDRASSGYNEVVLKLDDVTLNQDSVIEAKSYTFEILPVEERGYFEIPQQLDANPNNEEVLEQSYGDFVPHFTSIMAGQDTFEGNTLGFNNFRDTAQDPSKGSYILQNDSSLLKTMLTASEDSLDNIKASRFATNEYVNFKSKFLKVARQLDIRGYEPLLSADDIAIDLWLEEIFNVLTISKEFSKSFAYSYMIGRTDLFSTETKFVDGITNDWTLFPDDTVFVDLADPRNTMYLYNVTDSNNDDIIEDAVMLLAGVDYTVDTETATISWIDSGKVIAGDTVVARIYEDTPPAYIPATPSKLGMAPVFIPALEVDTTFTDPVLTIVGHDGSRVPVFGHYLVDESVEAQRLIPIDPSVTDARDNVLFELEKRIYNSINTAFVEDETILPIEAIRPGFFRPEELNRYSREEYLHSTEAYISRWTAENKADYRLNEFYDSANWKTWNYSSQQYNNENLPGHWKGIFLYFYDTVRPDTHPWEMLGHSIKPAGWDDIVDIWAYIETGGDNPLYARPGLSNIIPVDSNNDVRPVAEIFGLDTNGQWLGVDGPWVYGDGAPVEAAWYDSSEFKFNETEFIYLMKPAAYGEQFWDPANVEILETGTTDNAYQVLERATNERNKNSVQTVHGEKIDNVITYRTGYQQWITDRILFLNKDVTSTFGDKVRNLNVNLGHKMAAFTDKDTINVRLSSVSTESDTGNLIVPTTNYDVNLHTSPSTRDYVYSGVMIRADATGAFRVYGYDLLDQTFNVLPAKASSRAYQVNQGGTPASFKDFEFNERYSAGEYIRYQTRFYQCKVSHTANTFVSTNWTRLGALPEVGGVSVTHYTDREETAIQVPYSSIMKDVQEVYDFLIGYGAWLEQEGWKFENINDLNQIEDWKHAGNQFLFWVVNEWEPGNALLLSPSSTAVSLEVETGYPMNVERMTNGVYSIMGKYGFAIDPRDTTINRDNKEITVVPTAGDTGIYYFRVSTAETEHVLMFDNLTEFNDTIYSPLLRVRQDRLKFTGTRTLDWFGKMEAGGYLIQNDGLIQNFENLTQSITEYYNTETALDEPEVDLAIKHLVGYENKEYLDELEISDDVQFNFYQGYIREKGSLNAVSKLLRSGAIQDKQDISFFEEWAFKLQDFAGSEENVTIEFRSDYNDVKGDPQTYRLNHKRSDTGYVKNITLFNVEQLYNTVPDIAIGESPTGDNATAIAILGDDKKIASIDLLNAGSGYVTAPEVTIGTGEGVDRAYAVFQPDIMQDDPRDNIIDIDIDDSESWILRPQTEMVFPKTDIIDYQLPNAGYVHSDDVDFLAFDTSALFELWNNIETPAPEQTIWVAKTKQEDWGVYLVDNNGAVDDTAGVYSGGDAIADVQNLTDIEKSVTVLNISTTSVNDKLEDIADTKNTIDTLETSIETASAEMEDLVKQSKVVQSSLDANKKAQADTSVAITQGIASSTSWRYNNVVDLIAGDKAEVDYCASIVSGLESKINTLTLAITRTNAEIASTNLIYSGTQDTTGTVGRVIDTSRDGEATVTGTLTGTVTGDVAGTVENGTVANTEVTGTVTSTSDPLTGTLTSNVVAGDVSGTVENGIVNGSMVVGELSGGDITGTETDTYNLSSEDTRVRTSTEASKLTTQLSTLTADLTATEALLIDANNAYRDAIDALQATIDSYFNNGSSNNGTSPGVTTDSDLPSEGDPDYDGSIAELYATNAELAKEALDLNIQARQIREGAFDPVSGELVTEGLTHKNDIIRTSTQELAVTKSTLDVQLAELKVLVESEATTSQINNVATTIDSDLALININQDVLIVSDNILVQNKRHYETSYKYNDTSLDLMSGIVKIAHKVKDENENTIVTTDKLYRFTTPDNLPLGTYALADINGVLIKYSEEFAEYDEIEAPLSVEVSFSMLTSLRYKTVNDVPADIGYRTWIDNNGQWLVLNSDGETVRSATTLIETNLFENAFLRDPIDGTTSTRLPVYDPFKGIIAGPADQNIDYKASRDPARYTNSEDPRLVDDSNLFDADQVGMIWWDLSEIRYFYYEQPDTNKTSELEYRRNNWGRIFPGSTADIYEWVESSRSPKQYNGTGTPRNETDYVKVEKYNASLGANVVKYYFWVKDTTELTTNRPNRTLTALEVSRFVASPKSMAYAWFAPTQDTGESSSFVIANADTQLSNTTSIVQVNFKTREHATNSSTQWQLLREGDRFSVIPDNYWNKMVDSLIGYTDVLPDLPEYEDGIPVDGGYVLPVPDPQLSASEQRGIEIRPQQTMYVDVFGARKIMYQVVNDLVSDLKLWTEQFDFWDEYITSDSYWGYVDWYETDYDATNTIAKRQVADLDALNSISDLTDGELVKVYPFVPVESDRYEIYEYNADNNDFTLVRRQSGTFEFKETVYTDAYSITLRKEIREVLTALKENVFVDEYIVNENLLFFAMVNYSFSEQRNIDWAFKTTYISFLQDNVVLSQRPNFESDVLGEFVSYVNEVKPYHTKLRDTITVLTSTEDLAPGNVYDDAIGSFMCEPLLNPIKDHMYPGEMVTESCRWVDESITENLRNIAITMNFSRITCDEASEDYQVGTDCSKRPVFKEGEFTETPDVTTGYVDGVERDGNANYQRGETVRHELDHEAWDSSNTNHSTHAWDAYDPADETVIGYWDRANVTIVRYQQTEDELAQDFQDTEIDGSLFNHPDGAPEELVPANAKEGIVINVGYGQASASEIFESAHWDLDLWDNEVWDPGTDGNEAPDSNMTSAAYRINITPMGWTEYTKVNDGSATTLTAPLDRTALTMHVKNASVLPVPTSSEPGAVWIDAERIEYRRIEGNVLFDIVRGTDGTTPTKHNVLAKVFDGSIGTVIPNAESTKIDNAYDYFREMDELGNLVIKDVYIEYGGPSDVRNEQITLSAFDPWFKKIVDPETDDFYRQDDGTIILFENSPQAEFILASTPPPEIADE